MSFMFRLPPIAFVVILMLGPALAAIAATTRVSALADLSLEQLREIVVSSVSRRSEPLLGVAASVYVISADDIRRSGATTLPEALRLAPTLDVARADATQYAISARGLNNVLANKMLVMIDGRSIYTPLFAGVFWDAQDLVLADIERIEVITGPSTAQWGTNAVHGLIHVITRAAADTHGTALRAHAGNRERGGLARHGGRLGEDGHYRVYVKGYDRSHSERADGTPVRDQADGQQAGFRADWSAAGDALTVQGDLYSGTSDRTPSPIDLRGANLLGRWQRSLASGAQASVQAYVERTERDQPQGFSEKLETFDVVGQYGFSPLDGHRVLLGGGYRHSRDSTAGNAALAFIPANTKLDWSRLFVQDQIALTDRIALTVAASLEHNPYSGLETLPSLRLAWQPSDGMVWWGSAQRAVRAPSRIDRELFAPAAPPFVIAGGPNFEAEIADVLELGHRGQPSEDISYSLTLFHHDYDRLRSVVPRPSGLQLENGIEGSTRGLEITSSWRVNERWRVSGGGVWLDQKLRVKPGQVDTIGLAALGNDPHGWWKLRSSLDLTPKHSWDLSLRRVGKRPLPEVPAYTAVDTRLGWRVNPQLEVSLVVDNLLDERHAEWGPAASRVEFGRAASLQVRAEF